MLSTHEPTISASPHQPVPGSGTRRDHNAGQRQVRHECSRAQRAASGRARAARIDTTKRAARRRSQRCAALARAPRARNAAACQSQLLRPGTCRRCTSLGIAELQPLTCKARREPSRQQHGCAHGSNSIRAFRARPWSAASRPTHLLRKAPRVRTRRERAHCGDAGRVRAFRAARKLSGLAVSALRHAASATATSERGWACMHAAMAASHEI